MKIKPEHYHHACRIFDGYMDFIKEWKGELLETERHEFVREWETLMRTYFPMWEIFKV